MKGSNSLNVVASKEYKVYEDLGTVVSVLDDVVYIVGLFNGSMSEQIEFVGKGLKGVVINYSDILGMICVTVLGNSINIMVGDLVKRLDNSTAGLSNSFKKCSNCRIVGFSNHTRNRTRRGTKRYLLERLFLLNLNPEQKKEALRNMDILKKALKEYEDTELATLTKIQYYCLVVGVLNSLLSSSSGIVKLLPFVLYQHLSYELQVVYLIFTLCIIIIGFILTIYLTKKKVDFVRNYKLDCNPERNTRGAILFWLLKQNAGAIGTVFSMSGILVGDNLFEKFTGESGLTKMGKWLGIYHKQEDIYLVYDKTSLGKAGVLPEEEIKKIHEDIRKQVIKESRKKYGERYTRGRDEGPSMFHINDINEDDKKN